MILPKFMNHILFHRGTGFLQLLHVLGLRVLIVKGTDNEGYLHTTFEGNNSKSGCLFMDYRDNEDFSLFNTFIYGHNMKNGSMFGKLKKY